MKTKIEGEMRAFLDEVDYNGLNVVTEFIKFFETRAQNRPQFKQCRNISPGST